MIEGSRVTVQSAFNFLVGDEAKVDKSLPWDGYDMLADHAQALDMALQWGNDRRLPTPPLLQELAGAVMRTTGLQTNSMLGSTDAARGDFRVDKVSIMGASSFPNAQKVPALVQQLTTQLQQRMRQATTLQGQLHISFDAHQQLVSIHPFNDGNGRTSRLLMNYIQHYFGQPLRLYSAKISRSTSRCWNPAAKRKTLRDFGYLCWRNTPSRYYTSYPTLYRTISTSILTTIFTTKNLF